MDSKIINYTRGKDFAIYMDEKDPLRYFRDKFYIPKTKSGEEHIYLCGNSLGLQPKMAKEYVLQELTDWQNLGVEGHFHAQHPWMPYHEFLTDAMANVVGAKPSEVVVMNTLTTNLHLMMVSFYRPTPKRRKIVIDYSPFPSDRYAVTSQIKFHGYDPESDLIELKPEEGSEIVSLDSIKNILEKEGESIALIMLGGVNYYTGQLYDLDTITKLGHQYGCVVGYDLAHAAGNINLNLHDNGADFAVWCSYKYLNSGPGSLGGCFVHERHAHNFDLPRFSGWWGHDKQSRFKMPDKFLPIPGAEGWQLSNPPILPMAAMRASLEIFEAAGKIALKEKSILLTGYLEFLVNELKNEKIKIITPTEVLQRGCQLSIQVQDADKDIYNKITEAGVIADWREPDVIRVAPVPLYNTFQNVYNFVDILRFSVDH